MTTVDDLDDAAVLAALQVLTVEIRATLPAEQQEAISSQEEARLALAALLDQEQAPELAERFRDNPDQALADARELLDAAVQDPDTAEPAARLVEDPPADEQMVAMGGLEVVILVAALVTLLQTKAQIHVGRKDGKVDFTIDITKQAAKSSLIEKVVGIVSGLYGRQ
jgi:hypothetical protein